MGTAPDVVGGVNQTMGRLQVHSIPAVRKLNADIKLHGIVRSYAADYRFCGKPLPLAHKKVICGFGALP